MINEDRKLQYWNHFTSRTQKGFRPKNITDLRLGQIKQNILKDALFWEDVLSTIDTVDQAPEELMSSSDFDYQNTRSKFWVTIRKKIEQQSAESNKRYQNFKKR